MGNLTFCTDPKIKGIKLTDKTEAPFIISFRYPLEKGYTFKEMTLRHNKELQSFLDRVSQLSVQQVDEKYARKPDKNDSYKDMQIYHYEVSRSFRIHVVNEDGQYRIIRLDPNHKFHS